MDRYDQIYTWYIAVSSGTKSFIYLGQKLKYTIVQLVISECSRGLQTFHFVHKTCLCSQLIFLSQLHCRGRIQLVS